MADDGMKPLVYCSQRVGDGVASGMNLPAAQDIADGVSELGWTVRPTTLADYTSHTDLRKASTSICGRQQNIPRYG